MNADQVAALRLMLGTSAWLRQTRSFARVLRGAAPRTPGGLLIVGTPDTEPWHLAAHLDQESELAGIPGLAPTLVRWSPPPDAPPHLRVGLRVWLRWFETSGRAILVHASANFKPGMFAGTQQKWLV